MGGEIRILLLADSHLGFDLPVQPRIARRRRGHDFLANYARALEPALGGDVDLVVHAGDVFDRSSVVPTLAYQAFEPLRRIADRGVPVLVVPGNHERSRLPHLRFAQHPNLFVFKEPQTHLFTVRGTRVALSGFPYERNDVRRRFPALLDATGWQAVDADVRVLCVHHCVEGATVGPADYTFTTAPDVIRVRDVPAGFAAVLSGHIHRHQVLTMDLSRRPIDTPVLYPGSIERTALAEIGERKGCMLVSVGGGNPRVRWEFRELPARPMSRHELDATGSSPAALMEAVLGIARAAPEDAVLWIRLDGAVTDEQLRAVSAVRLRSLLPATMNLDVVPARLREEIPYKRRETARWDGGADDHSVQACLFTTPGQSRGA